MSRLIKRYHFILPILMLIGLSSFSQTKEELKAQQDAIQKEIKYKNKLLQETQKKTEKSVQQVVLIEKKITDRERYINAIKREVRYIEKQIVETENQIKLKEQEIETLKDEYAKMIYYAYKNRSSYDKLMFVFAADNFNQAYKRLMYYQQYSKYREQQAELIRKTQQELLQEIKNLQTQRNEKSELLRHEREERNLLAKERTEKQEVVNSLKQDENSLRAQINKNQKEMAKLQKMIQKIIAEELAAAEALNREGKIISENFEGNKTKLPWPVESGNITGKWGKQRHKILTDLEIQNNGIDISTMPESMARAVFEGEVTRVMIIPGQGKMIMIRHGEFYTVYGNLKETYVQKGDKVITKQEIGSIVTDDSKGITELHFEIWKGQTNMNPVDWIYKAK